MRRTRTRIRQVVTVFSLVFLTVGVDGIAQQPSSGTKNPPQSLAMGASKSRMTFFVTSKGLGQRELTDLAKADAHCQALAAAEGAGDHRWHAYLGTPARGERPAVSAIDRIGKGPWYNAEAELVAANREEIRAGATRLSKDTALTERGDPVEHLAALRQLGRFYCFAID